MRCFIVTPLPQVGSCASVNALLNKRLITVVLNFGYCKPIEIRNKEKLEVDCCIENLIFRSQKYGNHKLSQYF